MIDASDGSPRWSSANSEYALDFDARERGYGFDDSRLPIVESFPLRVNLLGGFRVERGGVVVPALSWQRRSAKQLTKLLATNLRHQMHREQIFEILWPKASVDSARNSLAKALHAARLVLEPERPRRRHSSYLDAHDDMVSLDATRVVIDADVFQRRAQRAIHAPTLDAYASALAMYRGALLPEDRYEDWASERRRHLSDLNLRLLLGLAEMLEARNDFVGAIDCLVAAVEEDATREDAHRRLMRVYQEIGARDLALRQYEICREHLRQELNRDPHPQTTEMYRQLVNAPMQQRARNI
jgi:DNA-binding SARP family transcriptional activator